MQRIIFFDGLCPLCDFFAGYVYSCDTSHLFLFASLQSKTAQEKLIALDVGPDTLVYLENDQLYIRSEAVLKIFSLLNVYGSAYWAPALLKIPQVIRDFFYKTFARNRYLIFKKRSSCRIPAPSEKKYFLD